MLQVNCKAGGDTSMLCQQQDVCNRTVSTEVRVIDEENPSSRISSLQLRDITTAPSCIVSEPLERHEMLSYCLK